MCLCVNVLCMMRACVCCDLHTVEFAGEQDVLTSMSPVSPPQVFSPEDASHTCTPPPMSAVARYLPS